MAFAVSCSETEHLLELFFPFLNEVSVLEAKADTSSDVAASFHMILPTALTHRYVNASERGRLKA